MTTPTQPTWRSHYTLLVLLFVYTMSFIDRQIMGILIQPIKTEFDVSDTAMGVLSGLTFALFYSALAIPFGRYADRNNRRNFVAYCCAAWSAMTAVCGMAVGYWTLALARIGVAVGEAGGGAPSISMIADHYPPAQRGRAMGIYMLGPQLGILFGLTLGGWIAQHYGWRSAFLWMSLPGLLAAVMLRFSGTEPARGNWDAKDSIQADAPTESLRALATDLLRSLAFKRIALASLLMGFSGYGIGIWTSAFLVRSHGMTLQGAGMVMGLMGGLAAAFGAVASGWLSDRLVKRDARWRLGVPALGCLLSIPSGLAFYAMPMGEQWQLGPVLIPHAVGFYMCFGFTAVWWAAPVRAGGTTPARSWRRHLQFGGDHVWRWYRATGHRHVQRRAHARVWQRSATLRFGGDHRHLLFARCAVLYLGTQALCGRAADSAHPTHRVTRPQPPMQPGCRRWRP